MSPSKSVLFLLGFLLACPLSAQKPGFGLAFINSNTSADDIRPLAVARDDQGFVYMAGSVDPQNGVDLDPSAGVSNYFPPQFSWEDAFWMRFDSLGNFVNVITWTGHETNIIEHMEVAPNGDLIMAGIFRDTVDFDPGPGEAKLFVDRTTVQTTSTWVDIFMMRMTPQGQLVWAKSLDGNGEERLRDMELDAAGNIYLTGEFYDTLDFDPGPGVFDVGTFDPAPFVAKFDPNGDLSWVSHVPGGQYMESFGVALDGQGNVFHMGYFDGTLDFHPGPGQVLLSHTDGPAYIQKLDGNGNFLWAKNYLGQGISLGGDVGADSSGNVYLTGTFTGSGVDFDPGPSTVTMSSTPTTGDKYILKLDSAGNYLWSYAMPGNGELIDEATETAPDGTTMIWGTFRDSVDLDPGIGIKGFNEFGPTAFIQQINPDGELNFAHIFHDDPHDIWPRAMWWDGGDRFFLTGNGRGGDVDFDPGPDSLMLGGVLNNPFLVEYSEDSCATLFLTIDSITGATCSLPGVVYTGLAGGIPPFQFGWNNGVAGPNLSFFTSGVYTVFLTDSLGCTRDRSVLLNAPPNFTGYDLRALAFNGIAFPGNNFNIWATAPNISCIPVSGQMDLVLSSGPVTYATATPAPDTIIGDTLR